jgi:transcriptional regulator with XRE-family HTH domain
MSLRSVARRMGVTVRQVIEQEDEASDLSLSTLLAWQQALEVPLSELLVEADGDLSTPVLHRARMIRVMKTAAAIRQESDREAIKHLADRLYDDLTQIMPELKDVGPWPSLSSRRPPGDCGRILQQRVSDDSLTPYDLS